MPAQRIEVRCPRCADKVELTISWAVVLTQSTPGKKCFITTEIGSSGREHTCTS